MYQKLEIGSLLFADVDQLDLTAPFEVLSRIPNASHRLYGRTTDIVRDVKGLALKADAVLSEAPALDILHIPGGLGEEAIAARTRRCSNGFAFMPARRRSCSQCAPARCCWAPPDCSSAVARRLTGRLFIFCLIFGARAVDERVVIDGTLVTAAGVTAGIDGALRVAAMIAGDDVAQQIQLEIAYAPDPPFNAGRPSSAPPHILAAARQTFAEVSKRREAAAAARKEVGTSQSGANEPC